MRMEWKRYPLCQSIHTAIPEVTPWSKRQEETSDPTQDFLLESNSAAQEVGRLNISDCSCSWWMITQLRYSSWLGPHSTAWNKTRGCLLSHCRDP